MAYTGPTIIVAQQTPTRGLACLSCGARFHHDQREQWTRHVVGCSHQHEEQERQMSARANGGVFGGDVVIPDLEEWVSRNRQALIEKRMKL